VGIRPDWAQNIIQFLEDGSLPEDRRKAKKLRMKAAKYMIVQGTLYKRGQTLCHAPKENKKGKRELVN
jgi:hypothetical protein